MNRFILVIYSFIFDILNGISIVGFECPSRVITDILRSVILQIYRKFKENVTVFIGPDNSRRFFTMDQYNGRNRFGYWKNMTCDSVKLATEGILYHQQISKEDYLHFFRKTLCRVTPLVYQSKWMPNGNIKGKAHYGEINGGFM
jgi:hypothetical protein